MRLGLITSTIAPHGNTYLLRHKDKSIRLNEYKDAFSFYCDLLKNHVFDAICYVDNSGVNLSEFRRIAEQKGVEDLVEFLSYKSKIQSNSSRFYLELNLISYFTNHTRFLKTNPDAIIWKITGRYKMINIADIIIKCSKKKNDLYLNYRNYPIKWVDLYLIGFSYVAYKEVFEKNLEIYNEYKSGEILFRNYLDSKYDQKDIKILKRFPVIPRILGVRGSDAKDYNDLTGVFKYYLRCLSNKVFPFIWI